MPHEPAPRGERALRGYAMVLTAATLWAVNGTVSKVILTSADISSARLAEVRSTGAFVGLALVLLAVRRSSLRLAARELPRLLVFGVVGLALVQTFYFAAIARLDIGIALLLQYLAPLLVALWARFAMGEAVRPRLWLALVLAFGGLALIVDVWRGLTLDGVGVLAALAAAATFALYILMAEREVGRRDAASLVCYGSFFAALFWALAQPWWTFPAHVVDERVSLLGNLEGHELPVWLLMAFMIVVGTIVPFGLLVGALRHLSATRAGIAAMWEPVAATAVAWAWLAESLDPLQILGGAVVLTGIAVAQTAR